MYKQIREFKKGLTIQIPTRRELLPYTDEQKHLLELEEKIKIIYKNQELFNSKMKNINKKIIFITFLAILLMILILLLFQR